MRTREQAGRRATSLDRMSCRCSFPHRKRSSAGQTNRNGVGTGEDLLRRIGSAPSYDQIIDKYKHDRDMTRHAGAGRRRVPKVEVEVNIDEIEFGHDSELNTSVIARSSERV